MASRTLISKLPSLLAARSARSTLHRLRPIVAVADSWRRPIARVAELRAFSTRPTTSSLNDPTPNWSNRPPKETILLDGCDFEHWLVVVDPPEPNMTREEIIDSYIKKLAEVVGSEEEARMKIYSVSTKHYFAFGALVSEEVSYKIKALSKVRWVLPDSYLDVRNKDYGGEPFIDGQAVPYDPKYHEEWVRNNARANERNRRNDRPRNNDRSRNFDRRRENMQQQNYQSRPPPPNQDFQNPDGPPMPSTMPPRNMPPVQGSTLQNGPPMPNSGGPPMPNREFNSGGPPMPNSGGPPMPNREFNSGGPPMPNSGGPPMPNREFNSGGPPMPNSGGPPMPNREFNSGGPPRAYPNQMPNPQNSYPPTGPGYQGNPGYQGGNPAAPNQGYGQGYQGGPQGYNNGGSPNYQQGGAPNYQQGRYPPQGGYSQVSPNYIPGGQGGVGQVSPSYTPGGQGGVGGPSYEQAPPSYQQGGQVGGPYQGNVPGRD